MNHSITNMIIIIPLIAKTHVNSIPFRRVFKLLPSRLNIPISSILLWQIWWWKEFVCSSGSTLDTLYNHISCVNLLFIFLYVNILREREVNKKVMFILIWTCINTISRRGWNETLFLFFISGFDISYSIFLFFLSFFWQGIEIYIEITM